MLNKQGKFDVKYSIAT